LRELQSRSLLRLRRPHDHAQCEAHCIASEAIEARRRANIHHVARRDCLPAKDQRERDSRNQIAVGIHDAAAGPMPLSPIACIEKQAVAGRRATAGLPMLIEPGQRFVGRENLRSKRATRKPQHRTGMPSKGRAVLRCRESASSRGACLRKHAGHTLMHRVGTTERTQSRCVVRCRAARDVRIVCAMSEAASDSGLISFQAVSERTRTAEPEQTAEHPGHANCHLRVRGRAQHHIDACRQGARSSRHGILSDPCVRVRVRRGIRLQVQRHGGHRSACF